MTLDEAKSKYPLLSREITTPGDINAKYVMMKNSSHKQEYFRLLTIFGTEFGMIYDSFEKKFMRWFEINKLTKEVKVPVINISAFIGERSIEKKANHAYLKMFYSKTEKDALEEFERLNK